MSTAVVEPVGRKANWSEMVLENTGSSRTGYKKERTIIFLNIIFLTTPCLQFVSRIYEVFYQN